MSRRTSRSSEEGAPLVEVLVASGFAYEAFHRTTSSSLELKNVGTRSFRLFAYRLLSAVFVYHATIGLHEGVPHAFPPSSCLTLLKLCCAVARQLHGHLQLYIYIYIYTFIIQHIDTLPKYGQNLSMYVQWRSKVVGTLVKTLQKITKESFATTIVIFKGTI